MLFSQKDHYRVFTTKIHTSDVEIMKGSKFSWGGGLGLWEVCSLCP